MSGHILSTMVHINKCRINGNRLGKYFYLHFIGKETSTEKLGNIFLILETSSRGRIGNCLF